MKQLEKSFAAYLRRIGRLEEVTLGPGDEHPATKEDSKFLIQSLQQQVKSSYYLIVAVILILYLSLLAAFFFLTWNRPDQQTATFVSGGAGAIAFAAVRWLHQLWREKTFTEISLTLLDQMPPKEAADIITIFYWSFMHKRSFFPDRSRGPGADQGG